MVELRSNPEEVNSQTVAAEPADLVIGLADPKAGENLPEIMSRVREGLRGLSQPARAVLLYKSGFAPPVSEVVLDEADSLRLLSYASPTLSPSAAISQTIAADYRAIIGASESLNAKTYVLISSDLETVTPEWFRYLVQPIAEQGYDMVSPCYVFHKFEGILNHAILYPLTRSLYGKRIRNPLGPDIGISNRLLHQVLVADNTRAKPGVARLPIPIGSEAASRGFHVCEAHLGERRNPPVDWKNISALLADVLGPVFLAMERDAAVWQRVRGSEPVPAIGAQLGYTQDAVAVEVRRLLEPFQLGFRNLQEIWSLLLPPKTQFELQRIGRLSPEQFRMPDELWVRIIYDFSLGYRLRTISRDHLLGALTPLYLGWIASYALEVENMSAYEAEQRVERLCEAFEAGKPYLVSRWRWPDRFNP